MPAITILNDVIMPESLIEAGVAGRNVRKNVRSANQAGFASANVIWTQTLRRFDIGFIPMTVALWRTLEGLHEVTYAGAYGFLMRDPKDSTVLSGEGLLQPYNAANVGTIGLGYGIPTYRLSKRYTVAGSTRTKDRRITRPITAAITRGGVAVTSGVSAGQIALNSDTGTVTFVADTSQAITSISAGATTDLNFSSGAGMVAAMSVGNRVYVSGVTGTAAAALNGLSHVISAKGTASLTLLTNTSGLSVTAPGTAYKYPQPTEALVWTGAFYVPVQFEVDELSWDMVAAGAADDRFVAGPQVTLLEVREP